MKITWPFTEILAPVSEEALFDLRAPAAIRQAFAQFLESRLAEVLGQCLYVDFVAHRMAAEGFHGSRSGCYADFVATVMREGLPAILHEYPVAVSAIPVLARQARACAEALAVHLAEDRDSVAKLLGTARTPGLRHAEAGLSDPHRGGRTVVRLSFEAGSEIYYKPRSVAVDQVFRDGLVDFNRRLRLPLRAPAVADFGDHGWAEAIREEPTMSQTQANAFYWRYGALLGVAWLLDAVDLHRENIVIGRGEPVLVDAESLLHSNPSSGQRTLATTSILASVDDPFDMSCLGATDAQQGPTMLHWKDRGTDDLRLNVASGTIREAAHLPRVRGRLVTPVSAARHIRAGFAAAARAAAADSAAVEAWRGRLAETPRRRIVRATMYYVHLLREVTHPVNLGSSRLWERKIARLLSDNVEASVRREELKQLLQWDIPYLTSSRDEPSPLAWDGLDDCAKELQSYFGHQ